MKKSIFAALGLLAAASLILASCAAPAPQVITQVVKETQIVEATVIVAPTSPPEKVQGTIRVGSWDSGDMLEPFDGAIKSFEAKYPQVTVQLEAVPQDYGDKLLTQFAAGTAPDVFQVGDGSVAEYIGKGVIEPLDPYITGDNPLDMGVFFPAIAALGQKDGSTYLLTKDYSPLVLYYNKTLFDAAGVEYPDENWTWDDFLAAAQALTKDTNGDGEADQWGVQLPGHWGDWLWLRGILPIIYQNGGDVISPDGTKTTGYLNSPETVAALQWYSDLFLKYKVAPTKSDVEALAGTDLFQSGLVAMEWTGRWPLKDYLRNPKLNFGTSGLPAGPKGHANSICWAGFAVYSESQNKDTAWAFVKWIAAEQGAQEFAKYAFTAVQPIAELQGLDSDPYNAPIVKDLENVEPLPDFRNPKFGACVDKYFKENLEKVFLQGTPVQAAMDEAAKQADACLAQP